MSISVVPSRWNEPFGRASLEAASRGCAVIISNKGGLPEAAPSAIVLKSLTINDIYQSIDRLITNSIYLNDQQKKNYKNFKFDHKYICNIIDSIRKEFTNKDKINRININRKSVLKILHITNLNERFNGRLHYNTGRRLNNGLIRLGHNVLTLSDRDIIYNTKNIRDFNGVKSLANIVEDTFNNFKPNMVILGHADAIQLETLDLFKKQNNQLKISQWFLDPLGKHGPDHRKNTNRIEHKKDFMDSTFLTTDPKSLSLKNKNTFFIPNPCDHSFETLSNYENETLNDLFFAMSHGVHRGELKSGKIDNREIFINKLLKKNKDIKFDIYGMNNVQPIWGDDFISKISMSSMGLNLSRGKPIKYYSSDRIAQLLGNGLLTFVHKDTMLGDFLSSNEIVLYDNLKDLGEKINKFKKDKKLRKKIAKNGKATYFRDFNSTKVAKYIIDKTFEVNSSDKYIWEGKN